MVKSLSNLQIACCLHHKKREQISYNFGKNQINHKEFTNPPRCAIKNTHREPWRRFWGGRARWHESWYNEGAPVKTHLRSDDGW